MAPNGTDGVLSMPDMLTMTDGLGTRTTPVRHGAHLTLSDHERLRVFVQEFVMKGLIPWAEKTIRVLNEQVG